MSLFYVHSELVTRKNLTSRKAMMGRLHARISFNAARHPGHYALRSHGLCRSAPVAAGRCPKGRGVACRRAVRGGRRRRARPSRLRAPLPHPTHAGPRQGARRRKAGEFAKARFLRRERLREQRAREIAVNAVIPVLLATSRATRDRALSRACVACYQTFPALGDNTVIREARRLLGQRGPKLRLSACEHQGLMRLYRRAVQGSRRERPPA